MIITDPTKHEKRRPYKVTSNKRKRTYTIVLSGNRYRTLPLTKEEFEEFEYNTPIDWSCYVHTSNNVISL